MAPADTEGFDLEAVLTAHYTCNYVLSFPWVAVPSETDLTRAESLLSRQPQWTSVPSRRLMWDRLLLLARNKEWKRLKAFLAEQPVEQLIDALKVEDRLVRNTAAYLLIDRTGQTDLGTDHDAWKEWWETQGRALEGKATGR